MPDVDDRLREELFREVVPGDPVGVAERVVARSLRLKHRRQAGMAALAVTVVAGSVLGATLLLRVFGRAPKPIVPVTGSSTGGTAATSPILFTGADPRTGIYGIYLINPITQTTRLVPGTGSLGPAGPAWSPSGREIAFYEGGVGAKPGVVVMNLSDFTVRHITTFGLEPEWSPDGDLIAFFWSPEGTVHDHIWVVHRDGTGLRQLGPGAWPAWSPDGTHIVFSTDGDQLEVMASDGSNVHSLGVNGIRPDWSPDGSTIAFSRDDGIYAMRADGSHVRKLTNGRPDYEDPDWSPDGTMIAFSHGTPGADANCGGATACMMSREELWVMNADGSHPKQLTHWASVIHGNGGTEPAWAPVTIPLP
jgi:Tol biopolymer transport system component